ncbi:MAG: hypothetical protein LBG05_05160 [Treponema sp.]|jgi:hypothetical protein|nr:hypothetical protein [Treponema sp.]
MSNLYVRLLAHVLARLLIVSGILNALGSEEAAPAPVNTEWVFVMTSIDIFGVPTPMQSIGNVVEKSLYQRLHSISSHRCAGEEYQYYKNKAWAKVRTDAAKKLADKRTQRDAVVFQGNPEWKYKKSIKTIDGDILKLEEEFRNADAKAPYIAEEVVFKFAEANRSGIFPVPPKSGGERQFCIAQKADAFMSGVITEYHGRVLLKLKVWSLAFNAFIYENNILFSAEDAFVAVGELTAELIETISGYRSARIAVRTDAPDALIFIGDNLVEKAEEETLQPPGKVSVTVSAGNRKTVSVPLELAEDENVEVSVPLAPIELAPMSITAFDKTGELTAPVYKGALYLGNTPFTFDLPVNVFDYFRVEMEGNRGSLAVFENTPNEASGIKRLKTRLLPDPEKKPVEKARDRMYLSYGLFWMSLPLAMVAGFPWEGGGGMYGSAFKEAQTSPTADNAARAETLLAVSIAATVAVGLTIADTVYRAVKYFTIANDNSPVLVK